MTNIAAGLTVIIGELWRHGFRLTFRIFQFGLVLFVSCFFFLPPFSNKRIYAFKKKEFNATENVCHLHNIKSLLPIILVGRIFVVQICDLCSVIAVFNVYFIFYYFSISIGWPFLFVVVFFSSHFSLMSNKFYFFFQ